MKSDLAKLLIEGSRLETINSIAMSTMDAATLADYLLANKVCLLPFNVGDIIYYIDTESYTIETDIIERVTVTKKGFYPKLKKHTNGFWKAYKWFTSYESAQKFFNRLKDWIE